MYSLVFLLVVAFVSCLVLTPLVRDAFLRMGVVDQPDFGRKIHTRSIPRVGGIPIAISYVGAYIALLLSPSTVGPIIESNLNLIGKLLPAAGLILLTGVIDDVRGLRPWQKLAGQFGAAVIVCAAGVRISSIAGRPTEAWWSWPLTILWLLMCCNAFNLIDGVDGLAAGIGLLTTLTIFLAALLTANPSLAIATIPLAGALAAFLRYNFNPASVFLGDSGSLLIGFLLGCYAVIWSQKAATLLALSAPALAFSLPILEVMLSIARRFLRGENIFSADRGHIHHRLLDLGLQPRSVALLLYAVCGIAAAVSLTQIRMQSQAAGLILVLFCATLWFGIRKLGYVEFVSVGRAIGGGFRNTLSSDVVLCKFEADLRGAQSPEAVMALVTQLAGRFGCALSSVRFAGAVLDEAEGLLPDEAWTMTIPLSANDYVSLARAFDSPAPQPGGALADVLGRSLREKLRQFEFPKETRKKLSAVAGRE